MVSPTISVDLLTYFIWIVYSILVPIVFAFVYFGTTKRRLGKLGKAELGWKSGIIGILCPPDGNVGIERLRQHYTGILYSVAKSPAYGRIFFSGRDAILRPIGAARLAFIEARSGLATPPDVLALAEVLSGQKWYKRQRKNVPHVDSIEQLIIHWAETRYFPFQNYVPRVRNLTPEERATLSKKDPNSYQQWAQELLADQTSAVYFEIDRINNLQVLNEIKTGVIRKITTIEKLEVDNTNLLVKPKIREEIAQVKMRDDEVHEWFMKMVQLAASDPEKWPAEVGGREGDIRDIFKWNVTTFSSGDVSALDAVTKELARMDSGRDIVKFVGIGVMILLSCLGVVIVISQLHL